MGGERISFVVTIVLAVVIFLLMFAEQLPKTHEETRVTTIFAWILYTAVGFMALTIVHIYVKNALKVRADIREQTMKRDEEKARHEELSTSIRRMGTETTSSNLPRAVTP